MVPPEGDDDFLPHSTAASHRRCCCHHRRLFEVTNGRGTLTDEGGRMDGWKMSVSTLPRQGLGYRSIGSSKTPSSSFSSGGWRDKKASTTNSSNWDCTSHDTILLPRLLLLLLLVCSHVQLRASHDATKQQFRRFHLVSSRHPPSLPRAISTDWLLRKSS